MHKETALADLGGKACSWAWEGAGGGVGFGGDLGVEDGGRVDVLSDGFCARVVVDGLARVLGGLLGFGGAQLGRGRAYWDCDCVGGLGVDGGLRKEGEAGSQSCNWHGALGIVSVTFGLIDVELCLVHAHAVTAVGRPCQVVCVYQDGGWIKS